jgi:hypothetical protein
MYGTPAMGWTRFLLLAVLLVTGTFRATAQDDAMPEKDTRPVKNTFESIWLMDAQTVMVPIKGTFQMDFQHRFGTFENGYDDFWGIFAASNIRIGFDYVPVDRLMIGLGFTKDSLLWDFYGKYALMRQGRSGGSPVSLTYYVNAAVDTRAEEKTSFSEFSDRWSFFHQLMVARKFGDKLSLQGSINLSWFNYKPLGIAEGETSPSSDDNAHISASFAGRFKLSNTFGLTAAYDLPITEHAFFNPEPNLQFGIELVTSSHAFQIFVGNYKSLVPQYNHTYNTNGFNTGPLDQNQFLLGFNITRLWNL